MHTILEPCMPHDDTSFTSLFIFTPEGHKPMWQFTYQIDISTIELHMYLYKH